MALFLGCATIHYRTRIPSATYKNGDQDQVNLFVDSCVFILSSAALNQVSRLLKAALTSCILSYKWQLTLSISLVHAKRTPALPRCFRDTLHIRNPLGPVHPQLFSDSRSKLRSWKSSLPSPRFRPTHSSQIRNFPRDEPPSNHCFSSL
jgi:hypothetical protein